jgi:DNA replication protein DnaC
MTPFSDLDQQLSDLKWPCIAEHYAPMATQAAHQAWAHVDSWARLTQGAVDVRRARATQHRMRLARFPVINTLEQFRWDWPTQIHRLQGQHHFRLGCIQDRVTRISLSGVGLGKTHLATA